MNFIQKLALELKKRPLLTAILIGDVITTFFFLLNPFDLLLPGDIDIFFGLLSALLYIIRKRNTSEGILGLCLKTGILTGLISSVSISSISLILYHSDQENVFQVIGIVFLMGQFLGLFLGFFFGTILHFRENQQNKFKRVGSHQPE